ncbi:hypothetical protein KM043_000601 [Ampulex compressa]|nr:hypothetical protein KM043_000601 [Ampulex compressa]
MPRRAARLFYRYVCKRTSTYVLGMLVSAVFFEEAYDRACECLFETINEGRLWKHIKDKYEIPSTNVRHDRRSTEKATPNCRSSAEKKRFSSIERSAASSGASIVPTKLTRISQRFIDDFQILFIMYRKGLLVVLIFVRLKYGQLVKISLEGEERDVDPRKIEEESEDGERVNLAGSGMDKIPEDFADSANIRALSFEGNIIRHVPHNAFHRLPNLSYLSLAKNQIPLEQLITFGHENLRILNVSYQEPTRPRSFGSPLDFGADSDSPSSSESITVDVSLTRFPRLEHLDLSGNEFDNIAINFNLSVPRLTSLYLRDRNIKEISPEFFRKLPLSLSHLYLEKNVIEEINGPYLANISAIFLDGNPLSSSSGIYCKTLKLLSVSNCSFTRVFPNFFRGAPFLETVDLSYNRIETLDVDTFTYLGNLQKLSLGHNLLSTFPYKLPALSTLNDLSLSYNKIDNLDRAVQFASLRRLNLRGNGITNIDRLTFSRLTLLEELDLAENYLTSLPSAWMEATKSLRHLNLKFNRLESIEDMAIHRHSSLKHLYLKSNALKIIDVESFKILPENIVVHVG